MSEVTTPKDKSNDLMSTKSIVLHTIGWVFTAALFGMAGYLKGHEDLVDWLWNVAFFVSSAGAPIGLILLCAWTDRLIKRFAARMTPPNVLETTRR